METKKQIVQTANYCLKCFNKMFDNGGNYKELSDKKKKHFKIILFYYPEEKLTITIPLSEQEYNSWRKIKPSMKQGGAINAN